MEARADSNVERNITDVCDGEIVKEICEKFNCSDTIICSLSLNFDGAIRYKSNNLPIWPIQLVQNFLPPSIRYRRENIIIAGLFYGKHKPDCLEYFLPPINELKRFVDQNIEMQLRGIRIKILPLITHCPRNRIFNKRLSIMRETDVLIASTLDVKSRRLREEFDILCAYRRTIYGTKRAHSQQCTNRTKQPNESAASKVYHVLCRFHISILCLDFALTWHCVCLGVVPNMNQFWCSASNSKQRFSISKEKQLILNKRLLSLKPPREFSRRPRSLGECSKANEWRALLLFTLPMCLENPFVQ